ncbi:MAG: SDR family oxidoreductase [Deltaproteobacteria bacterium]|nr:MAG: SDR family oxidoreductase [Deltaproteobacteria bacterium]
MPETRTALITGASAGLGAEFARQLAARGDRLILVARRKEKLEALAESLRAKHGTEVHVLTGDLSLPETPAMLLEQVTELGLHVDVLINNAGIAGPHLLEDRDWAQQQAFFELMIVSVAHMCHHFVPGMVERGYGRVCNVASMAGRITRPAGANYGPAKAYVIALSKELHVLVSDKGVHVSALCPGFTHTEFHAAGGLDEMKRGLPSWVWYDADVVVAEGLAGMEAGRSVQISGRLYRIADVLARSPFVRPLINRTRR